MGIRLEIQEPVNILSLLSMDNLIYLLICLVLENTLKCRFYLLVFSLFFFLGEAFFFWLGGEGWGEEKLGWKEGDGGSEPRPLE